MEASVVNLVLSIAAFLIISLISIVMFFLRKKDADQEKQINLLFKKHDEDAAALMELKIKLASTTYERQELDSRFHDLGSTFREVGKSLEVKFDELQKTLLKHVMDHHRKGDGQ